MPHRDALNILRVGDNPPGARRELAGLGLAPAGSSRHKGRYVYGTVETSSERRQTQQNCPSTMMRPSEKT
jgi:hypothetical protein